MANKKTKKEFFIELLAIAETDGGETCIRRRTSGCKAEGTEKCGEPAGSGGERSF